MLTLIINADDLGLTPGCIDGILTAMTAGIVTDTTLLVNTEFTARAVAALKQQGITQAGLHLNLTYGEPVLAASQVASLVDESGRFRRKAAAAVPLMNLEEAKCELSAQVEKFQATGLALTHLDSHHHVHTYPALLPAAIELARQLQVPLRQGNETVRQAIRQAGLATTDNLALDFYEQGATLENLQQILQNHPRGSLEIMCHPAKPDQLLYDISSYNHWRSKELAVLTSQEMKEFIANNGIRLAGFDALQG